MLYDSTNDVVLLIYHSFNYSKKELLGVYVYNPESNSWADEVLPIPAKLGGSRKAKNGFYNPSLNAIIHLDADGARHRARQADEALAHGNTSIIHGFFYKIT